MLYTSKNFEMHMLMLFSMFDLAPVQQAMYSL